MGEGMWSRSRSAALALCPFPAHFPDLCVEGVVVVLLCHTSSAQQPWGSSFPSPPRVLWGRDPEFPVEV